LKLLGCKTVHSTPDACTASWAAYMPIASGPTPATAARSWTLRPDWATTRRAPAFTAAATNASAGNGWSGAMM